MTIGQVALQLWPCWTMGVIMIYLTWASQYRSVLKIDPIAILKFCRALVLIAALRFIIFHYFTPDAIIQQTRGMTDLIPWQALLGVFWEDACHSMPLVLAGLMFGANKWFKRLSLPLLAIVMLSFGSGHIYQGAMSASLIAFYIPLAMKMGKKYGFGTVMICHILYDLSTFLSFKWMLGH